MGEVAMGKIFSKHSITVTGILLSVILLCGRADAAQSEADLFEKAYGYYLSYHPEKAIEVFDQFMAQFPSSSALDSVMFWRATSLTQMKRFDEAARDFRLMKERFPDSSYTVFAEKELDAIQQLTRETEKQAVSKERTPKQGDTRSSVYEDKIVRLESEISDLKKKLGDSEKLRRLTEKELARALDDKNGLDARIEDVRSMREGLDKKLASAEKCEKDYARLVEDRKALEAKLKKAETDRMALEEQLGREKKVVAEEPKKPTPEATKKKEAKPAASLLYHVSNVSIIEAKEKEMLVITVTNPNGNLEYGDEIESKSGKDWLKVKMKPAVNSTEKTFKFKSAYVGAVIVEEDKSGGQNLVNMYIELIPAGLTYDIARIKNTLVITFSNP